MPPLDCVDTVQARAGVPSDAAAMLALYRAMQRIRVAEQKIVELYRRQQMRCPVHLHIGQEAVSAGVAAALDAGRGDCLFASHRSHGPYLALDGDLPAFFGELYGKVSGCCRGRGGSMHLIDRRVGYLGSSAIVAGTIPMAVGAALAARARGESSIAAVFFGDGAADEGVCYESINFAALHGLPVLFICENNLYATCSPLASRQALDNFPERARAFGATALRIDGNDVLQVAAVAHRAAERARGGGGPTCIEARTYRWKGHVGIESDMAAGYRGAAELAEWLARCPIRRMERRLAQLGQVTAPELERVRQDVTRQVEAAVASAEAAPFPDARDFLAEAESGGSRFRADRPRHGGNRAPA
jgi:pyruvate dehydrogenase E1 component alpha subunit